MGDKGKRVHPGMEDAAKLAEKMVGRGTKVTFVWAVVGRPHATTDNPEKTAYVKTLCDEEVKAERTSERIPGEMCVECERVLSDMSLVEG